MTSPVQAVDDNDVQLAVTTGLRGKVDAVQRIDGEFHLSVGDLDVPLSKVGSVRSATASAATTARPDCPNPLSPPKEDFRRKK